MSKTSKRFLRWSTKQAYISTYMSLAICVGMLRENRVSQMPSSFLNSNWVWNLSCCIRIHNFQTHQLFWAKSRKLASDTPSSLIRCLKVSACTSTVLRWHVTLLYCFWMSLITFACRGRFGRLALKMFVTYSLCPTRICFTILFTASFC